jgi:hypothetical protein
MLGELDGLEVGMNDEAVQLRDRFDPVRNFHKECPRIIGRVGPGGPQPDEAADQR